jgi:dipeptidyl aminopeptidase/acylaminoacyl peptidase
MMSEKSFIDAKRMGLQGHSFGAYEVNYIITRTTLFSAAASAAGPSDLVSQYGALMIKTLVGQNFAEFSQTRMGVTLWKNPQAYINNSPLFGADKIQTPLLMMHNQQDYSVGWPQAVEFFTALRRLEKRVWLLEYDNGFHVLYDEKDQRDYTTRLAQFFDHYLMGMPAPKWMTQGRPAHLKQMDDRFELDAEGSCGGDCRVCHGKKQK